MAVERKTTTARPLKCVQCKQSLSTQPYILHDTQPYCINCYESNYANVCAACGLIIATDSKVGLERRSSSKR